MIAAKYSLPWLGLFFLLLLGSARAGEQYGQSPALAGLNNVKIYFDVNVGIPEKLVTRLAFINQVDDQLKKEGVKPEIVIGFRGKASKFVTKGKEFYVEEEEQAGKAKVQHWLETFAKKGFHMEQCLLAADLLGIAPEDFRPELTLVKNGYISMIAYQQQGFAQIPMD